ncbi:MAG: tryptophan synthase subunit alpha, partial [Hydrogenovibrio sp.]|nr:tryptophan synthase subunit alpha [Hydrogenovibrio sp.]
MSRINQVLTSLKAQGKTALIPYVTAGDPHPDMTLDLMHTLVEQGADLIELGVPFSDPMADGPVIQKAVERALEHHVTLKDVLAMVSEFRKTNDSTPVILMGYLNPIEAMGYEKFAELSKAAGVDAVLTVDMPPEESAGYLDVIRDAGLDRIFLVSPTTPDRRLQAVNEQGSGFVYYVSLKGVTGSKALDVADVTYHVNHLKTHLSL